MLGAGATSAVHGRGVPGHLDVITEVDGDRIKVRYDPAVWAGAGDFFVELYAPNLWRNRLGRRAWVLAAFVILVGLWHRRRLRS